MAAPFSVLVFSKTAAYRHESIEPAVAMFRRLAAASTTTAHPFVVDASEDAGATFTAANLARYAVVVLLHCSGVFLDASQVAALEAYVRGGTGGVVGIHAAAGGLQSLEVDPTGFYGRLLGAVFTDHPPAQPGRVLVEAPTHPVAEPFGEAATTATTAATAATAATATAEKPVSSLTCLDEWYNFTPASAAVVAAHALVDGTPQDAARIAAGTDPCLLLLADEASYTGGKHGARHPVAWTWPDFERSGTRVCYTSMGHFAAAYADAVFVEHLRRAVLWTARVL